MLPTFDFIEDFYYFYRYLKLMQDLQHTAQDSFSQDELREMFVNAGFRIINMESSVKKYAYPDISSFLGNYDRLYFYYYYFLFDQNSKATMTMIFS